MPAGIHASVPSRPRGTRPWHSCTFAPNATGVCFDRAKERAEMTRPHPDADAQLPADVCQPLDSIQLVFHVSSRCFRREACSRGLSSGRLMRSASLPGDPSRAAPRRHAARRIAHRSSSRPTTSVRRGRTCQEGLGNLHRTTAIAVSAPQSLG